MKLFNISDYKQKILIHLKSPIFLQNRFQYLISIECYVELKTWLSRQTFQFLSLWMAHLEIYCWILEYPSTNKNILYPSHTLKGFKWYNRNATIYNDHPRSLLIVVKSTTQYWKFLFSKRQKIFIVKWQKMIRTEVICVYYTRDILTLTCHYNNGYLAVLIPKIHLPDTIV